MENIKSLKEIIIEYGSIPEGYYLDEKSQVPEDEESDYDKIRARRDNMTNVGNLDYEI